MTSTLSRSLACEPSAVAEARRWCRLQIQDAMPAALVYDALLVVSELVTNAIRASCGRLTLTLTIDASGLSIIVSDDAAGRPEITRATENDETGRGLSIVASLSLASGVRPSQDGKEVWAHLPVLESLAI
jgi:two-component sensor histidine kinase